MSGTLDGRTDWITISGLRLLTRIGVYPHEQARLQAIVISMRLGCDLSIPAASDSLADTVDYDAICSLILNHIESQSYRLIERVAGDCISRVMDHFPSIHTVSVTVEKPSVVAKTTSVSVTLTRQRAIR